MSEKKMQNWFKMVKNAYGLEKDRDVWKKIEEIDRIADKTTKTIICNTIRFLQYEEYDESYYSGVDFARAGKGLSIQKPARALPKYSIARIQDIVSKEYPQRKEHVNKALQKIIEEKERHPDKPIKRHILLDRKKGRYLDIVLGKEVSRHKVLVFQGKRRGTYP